MKINDTQLKENFLHYIWKYQDYDLGDLLTSQKEIIQVIHKGFHNHDSGPDFSEAKIKIGNVSWAGNVEIHLKSSDWLHHKHQEDRAYDNVILHVVWEDDVPILNSEKQIIPTLELKNRVSKSLLGKYSALLNSSSPIACANNFYSINELKKMSMLDTALARRMERKAESVLDLLSQNNGDWEETVYQLLSRNFGFKLNSEAFERLARSIPLSFLQKHRNEPNMLEALLFGQAGFLENNEDPYALDLKQHFDFLSKKFKLTPSKMMRSQWKFMRTRPGNFPTVRLAQLAAILCSTNQLMAKFINAEKLQDIENWLRISPSTYWQSHYDFGKDFQNGQNKMGKASFQNLATNTIVPFLVAYGKYIGEQYYYEKAMSFLEDIPAEENKITKQWKSLGLKIKTMQDSQGAIEQYNEFCQKLNCMECTVGVGIMRE